MRVWRIWVVIATGVATRALGAPSSPFADRLVECLRGGDRDSCLALVQSDRTQVSTTILGWTVDALESRSGGGDRTAPGSLDTAARVAALYADAFGDSFYVRLVEYHDLLDRTRLPVVASAWRTYREGARLLDAFEAATLKDLLPRLNEQVHAAKDPYLDLFALRLTAKGLFYSGGALSEARAKMESARALALTMGDRAGALRDLGDISLAYSSEDRLDDALAILKQIIEPARQGKDWRLYVFALKSLAMNMVQRGEFDEAIAAARKGIPEAHARGLFGFESECWVASANAHGMLGHLDLALEHAESTRAAARRAGNPYMELSAIITAGQFLTQDEQYSRALALMREGLPLAERVGHREAIFLLNTQIGEVYQRVGRPEAALQHYEAMLPVAREMEVPREVSSALRNIGLVKMELGDLKGATAAFESALLSVKDLPVRVYVSGAALDLGRAYLACGDLARAETALTQAKGMADSSRNPYLSSEAERLMGDLAARQGHEYQALTRYDNAIEVARRLRTPALLRQALVQKARLLLGRSDPAGADTLLAEALQIVETVRGEQAGEAIRVGFLTDKKDIALLRAMSLHALGRDGDAFIVAEEARARALLDLLSGSLPEPSQNVDSTLHEKETRLAARLGTLQEDITRQVAQDGWDEARLDSLEGLRLETARAYREVIEEIAVRDPAYAALASPRASLRVAEIRSRVLSSDQVLLEYLVGDSTSMLFLLRPDALRAFSLSWGERELGPEVAAFRAAIATNTEDAQVLAQKLYSRVLEPATADLPEGTRLLVVPDGSLFQLPFAALRNGAHFLVERHALAYAPSASVLDPQLDTRNKRTKKSLFLAIGNPASYRTRELLAEARDGTRWRFGELPYAEEEARRIAALFPKSTLLLGREATEEEVKRIIGEARQVHFATHAIASEEEPMLSGLVLAEDENPAEDGFLQVHEILKLPLHADLVALSACNTGLGHFAGGEGVLGLTRSFLYAGARSVLISLWEVADRSTLEIMSAFYQHAGGDKPLYDGSLREAQVELMRKGAPIREWAPFAIVGQTRPADYHRSPTLIIWGVPLLLAGAMLAVWMLRKTRTAAPPEG